VIYNRQDVIEIMKCAHAVPLNPNKPVNLACGRKRKCKSLPSGLKKLLDDQNGSLRRV